MALPNSRILMHQPSAGFEGQATDIEIHAAEVLSYANGLTRSTRNTASSRKKKSTLIWTADRLKPEEAVEYGLIDRVISRH